MDERSYFDHAASSPVVPGVTDAVRAVLEEGWGNPSSAHFEGRRARRRIDEARESVAALVGCEPGDVVFTSGGTESNALAVGGMLAAADPGAPLVLSTVEHSSVSRLAERAADAGRAVLHVGVSREGELDLAALDRALQSKPGLVSIMSANNETGTIFPIEEIAARCRAANAPLHSDAVHCLGKSETPLARLGADALSLSAHKIGGPQGAGAVILGKCVAIKDVLGAGNHERGLRGGTENLPGIVGFGVAARYWTENGESLRGHLRETGHAVRAILAAIEGAQILAEGAPGYASTCSVMVGGISGEALLQALDLEGISVSMGAACSSGALEPSKPLQGMGYAREEAASAVRFSVGWNTSAEDVTRLGRILPAIVERLRGAGRARQQRLNRASG
ncbi:MAG: cysteine desulfurase [Chrysiogenetes bacterium]|nr:cysteine desulfurase [Chrysiogenetes bacterium]